MSHQLSTVVLPDFLRDEDNARQPYSSMEVQAELVKIACQDDYSRTDMLNLCSANPGFDPRVDQLLSQAEASGDQQSSYCDEFETITLNRARQKELEAELQRSEANDSLHDDRPLIKAGFATELLLSLAARTANQHVAPFLVVRQLVGIAMSRVFCEIQDA